MDRIMIVEDDADIASFLELELQHEGFECSVAYDGQEALDLYDSFRPDIILLDLMIPKIDGFRVAESIRDYDEKIGIIMITAKGETYDKINGLKYADDYIVKPFKIEEVLARIGSLLRRMGKKDKLTCGNITIFPDKFQSFIGDQQIFLSLTEFNLLKVLMINKNSVLSKDKLMSEVWENNDIDNPNLIEVYLNYLRKKLGDSAKYIKTIRGVGYVIREE